MLKKPLSSDNAIETLKGVRKDLSRFHVGSLFIFGSVARNEARIDSDIDILVEFNAPVGLLEFIDLKNFLESIFHCKVDLATPDGLRKQYKDLILKEAVRAS